MTRVGLIGLGRWGRRLAEVLAGESLLSRCCSTSVGDGRIWARGNLPGVPWTADIGELVAATDVDAVAIATPVSTHFALAELALLHGKDVFVEKPLATDVDEAERLRRLAAKRAKTLMVDHTFLFDANIANLIDLVRNDPPRQIFMKWTKWGTFDDPMLWSLLPHDIALSLSLIEDVPQKIAGVGDISNRSCHRSLITLEYEQGEVVIIEVDRMVASRAKEVHVVTRSGKKYAWVNGELLGAPGTPAQLREAGKSSLVNAVRHFVDVREGRSLLEFDAGFAVKVTRVLCGIAAVQRAIRKDHAER